MYPQTDGSNRLATDAQDAHERESSPPGSAATVAGAVPLVDGGGALGLSVVVVVQVRAAPATPMHAMTVTVATLRLLGTVTSQDTPRPAETTPAEPQST